MIVARWNRRRRGSPQTLNYAGGGFVTGLPDQSHPVRPITARMAGDEKLDTQGRPLTDKTTLSDHVKGSVAVDPQNGPAPPPVPRGRRPR